MTVDVLVQNWQYPMSWSTVLLEAPHMIEFVFY